MRPRIGIIGEYHDNFEPHTALNKSLDYLRAEYDFQYEWLETEEVERQREGLLTGFAGIWSAPGSPFKSLEGALYAIKFARVNNIPHLGTCAGFQHGVLELARNLLGIEEARHQEYDPDSSKLFISKLVCSLAGKTMEVFLKGDTLARELYGLDRTQEDYYCNFGINPEFRDSLNHPLIAVSGVDQDDEIRIIELREHPFFLLTLFVPQTKSKPGKPHPLIEGFVRAACSK